MKSFMASIMVLSLLTGCQSTQTLGDLSKSLEGSQHKIWKEASYKGIRSELKEGEVITFKDVEAKLSYDNSEYYYLGHIYSSDGQLLFDKKYALSDVGVIQFKGYNIDKMIDPEVVNSLRGVRYHGNSGGANDFVSTYWKSSGGDEPKAMPVKDYKLANGERKVAQNNLTELRLNCISNNVYASFYDKRNIYAADNEDVTVTVFYPYSKGKRYQSKSIGHTGVALKVDPYIERILLKEDAIKFVAYSHGNHNFTEVTAYNNGLAEAYSRIKKSCSM